MTVRRWSWVLAVWAVVCAAWALAHPRTLDTAADAPGDAYLIDVNAASVADLRLLPGVGEALAERIVADRAERGPFGDVADLRRVHGIGPSVANQVSGLVGFGKREVKSEK